jgi:hypothetical protein
MPTHEQASAKKQTHLRDDLISRHGISLIKVENMVFFSKDLVGDAHLDAQNFREAYCDRGLLERFRTLKIEN